MTRLVPYRCAACRWRGWRPAVAVTPHTPSPTPDRLVPPRERYSRHRSRRIA